MHTPLTLNPANQQHWDGMGAAMAALVHLNDQGCQVISIELRGRRPKITIAPPTSPFLQGSLRLRLRSGNEYRVIKTTPVHGCQVEWTETLQAEVRAHG